MPMSGRERTRKWREKLKLDPSRRQQYLEKDRKAYHKRKDLGEIKGVTELSERDQRKKRRDWRLYQRNYRKQKKVAKEAEQFLTINSPPQSPEANTPIQSPSRDISETDGRTSRGRKRLRRERSKSYRLIGKLKALNEMKTKLIEKYRKRIYRLENKGVKAKSLTPRSKTKQLLRHALNSDKVKRTLTYHYALIDSLREKYITTKNKRQQQNFKMIFAKNILKRYKCLTRLHKDVCRVRKLHLFTDGVTAKVGTAMRSKFTQDDRNKVIKFLERPDNARMTAGKKETITKKKLKKQKMLLTDTMKNLHVKFLSENPEMSMSYSTFCLLRPFWVRRPTIKDREICICQIHDNVNFMFQKLKALGAIDQHPHAESLIDPLVCDHKRRDCAYRKCRNCVQRKIKLNEIDKTQQTEWSIWKKELQERYSKKKKEKVKYAVTVKKIETGSVEHLIESFQQSMIKLVKHVYNIRTQFRAVRHLKENIGQNEVIIHMDFSENWTCRYAREITSVHFGASTNTASLHDGIITTADKMETFCSISDSTQHDASAIWAHLQPLLNYIRKEYPQKTTLHCISDSPTSQYRGRRSLYLLSCIPRKMGFAKVMWHFLEAGHGKGPADGVGAAIKRNGDRLVANGKDVNDAKKLYDELVHSSTVKLFFVPEEKITEMAKVIPSDIPVFKGTMNVHQVYSGKMYELKCRPVSCLCEGTDNFCECHSPGTIVYQPFDVEAEKKEESITPTCTESATTGDFVVSDDMIGKWCVVTYEGKRYPGVIQDVDALDNTLEVSVMHSVGSNRFFWGRLPDVCWYKDEQFVDFISEPVAVTELHNSRHKMIKKDEWERISGLLK